MVADIQALYVATTSIAVGVISTIVHIYLIVQGASGVLTFIVRCQCDVLTLTLFRLVVKKQSSFYFKSNATMKMQVN